MASYDLREYINREYEENPIIEYQYTEEYIQYKNGDILRKFDYDTFNNSIFYINLSGWQKDIEIDKVKFSYCFMNEDVKIILNK